MMIVGIDDTDIIGSPGTNQLARRIAAELSERWCCVRIVRHQLLDDPRVPYTCKNGSASITLERRSDSGHSPDENAIDPSDLDALLDVCRRAMRDWFIEGSDPGLCLLAKKCPNDIVEWGQRCQQELVTREQAVQVASANDVHLESLGGTEDGVIGALAAVGLASTENDGRIVQLGEWPDDLSGPQSLSTLGRRGVRVFEQGTHREFTEGAVDIGKRLRPNMRGGTSVLFVEPLDTSIEQHSMQTTSETETTFRALKLP